MVKILLKLRLSTVFGPQQDIIKLDTYLLILIDLILLLCRTNRTECAEHQGSWGLRIDFDRSDESLHRALLDGGRQVQAHR